MKHLRLRSERTSDEPAIESGLDPQEQFLHRAFLIAHGQPIGPLSTLTRDLRLHTEPKCPGERRA